MANEELYLPDPDGRLCFAEYGAPDGRPLLYFHGWPSSRLQARLLDRPAREQGFRMIAPDRPGLGRSSPRPGFSLPDWPALVGKLADHLGLERFAAMGVSGGAPYALACAHGLPERTVAASCVSSAPPLAEFPDRSELMVPYRILLRLRPMAPLVFPVLLPFSRLVARQDPGRPPLSWFLRWLSPVDRAAVASDPDNWRVLMESFHEATRQGGGPVVADADRYLEDWEIDYSAISVPVDFWHGARDRNLPLSMIRKIAKRVPTARPHWLENEGHYSLPLVHSAAILRSLDDCAGRWEG